VGPAARLSVAVASETGDGLVRRSIVGIDCGTLAPSGFPAQVGTACAAVFPVGSTVTLAPLSFSSPTDVRWTGCSQVRQPSPPFDRSGPPWCDVTLAQETAVSVLFASRRS
jgi:hypothetical protein